MLVVTVLTRRITFTVPQTITTVLRPIVGNVGDKFVLNDEEYLAIREELEAARTERRIAYTNPVLGNESAIPTIVGSPEDPVLVGAAGGLTPVAANPQTIFVAGNGGPVAVTADPPIADGTQLGQMVTIVGTSDTDTVGFTEGASSKLLLNGDYTLGLNDVLTLQWIGAWLEMSRR